MDQLLIEIGKILNLNEAPALMDTLGILVSITLGGLGFLNLKTKSTSLQPSKEAKNVEIERVEAVITEPVELSWRERLIKGLSHTRDGVWGKIDTLLSAGNLSEDQLNDIEEILYTSDLSPALVEEVLAELLIWSKKEKEASDQFLVFMKNFLKSKIEKYQEKLSSSTLNFQNKGEGTKVIMIVGVNGAGKTTTIGKLATKLKNEGAHVVVGACDTFRAAAVEQLQVWCDRAEVELIKAKDGSDPSAVAYDTVKKAVELKADYCLIDTAGRLHTASNLMEELKKTKKVMSKILPAAPHETLLVIDAITGQNAIKQAEEFNKSLELTGLIFTKCDGSSKAGSAISIVEKLGTPISYIGVGEEVADLDKFDLDLYLDALLGISVNNSIKLT